MFRRLICVFFSSVLVLGLVQASMGQDVDPDLVGWWKFEEASGTLFDQSDNHNDSTSFNGALYQQAGQVGYALGFDGVDDYVVVGSTGRPTDTFSFGGWLKTAATHEVDPETTSGVGGVSGQRYAFEPQHGGDSNAGAGLSVGTNGILVYEHGSNYMPATAVYAVEIGNDWNHIMVVYNNKEPTIYLNGLAVRTGLTSPREIVNAPIRFGGMAYGYFEGSMDEVRIYSRALSAAEIRKLAARRKAWNADPADSAMYPETWVNLSWSPGDFAVSHDLYLGENFADVEAGTGGTFQGNQGATYFMVGLGMPGDPYPGGLVPGTTYYWRIDEVNDLDPNSPWKGDVWSFSLPPATAEEPVPADGAAYVDPATTLSWAPGYGSVLHHVYFSENAADVEATHTGDVWSFETIPVIPIRDPNLVGWWMMDDVGSGTVIDFSGYGHHGTIHGDPQYVPGPDGDAMDFDGTADYISLDGYKGILGPNPFSITAWINTSDTSGTLMGWGSTAGGTTRFEFRPDADELRAESSGNVQGLTTLPNNEWIHVAVTVKADAIITEPDVTLYLNGQVDNDPATGGTAALLMVAGFDVTIARRHNASERFFGALIDDLRLYDKELTAEEIQYIMARPNPYKAWAESPANGSTPDLVSVGTLSWSPGDLASQQDVYFGADGQAVADADASDTTGIYRGRQAATSYTPPQALEPEQTYYWRIDQYNTDGSITAGRVWSLTVGNFVLVDDFEAYDVGNNEIWWAWRDGIGFGTPDAPPYSAGNGTGSMVGDETTSSYTEQGIVNSGDQSMPYWYDNNQQGKFKYSEAKKTLTSGRNWTQNGVKALTLSFRGYGPSTGSFVEDPAGTYTITARGSDIYGSADHFHFAYKQLTGAGSIVARIDAARYTNAAAKAGLMIRETLDAESAHTFTFYRPDGGLRFNRRITAGDTTSGDDPGGTYTLPYWLKLERDIGGNFTAYHSADGTTWNMIGSQQTIQMGAAVYIGLAVTSHDDNRTCEATFSNVTITGTVSPMWTSQDIGILSNEAQPMYVAVANNTGAPAAVYHEDPAATQIGGWTEWNIELKAFSDQGINLADVNSIAIGFGNRNNPVAGGAGKMYFDDIRVYLPRCVASLAKPAVSLNEDCVVDYLDLDVMVADWGKSDAVVSTAAPTAAGLVAHYTFDGNANDSSGNGYHGVEKAGASYVAGKLDQALHLDGYDDYVAIEGLNYAATGYTATTVCCWIRTIQSTNGMMASFDRNEYWRLQIAGEAGGPGLLGWSVMTTAPDGTEVQMDYGSSRRVDDGQWHHVAGTFDNGTLSIYIDGALETEVVGNVIFGTGDLRYGFVGIGSEATEFNGYPNASGYYDGDIDDLRIYSRALSQAEIAYLADETPGDGELYAPVTSPANLYDSEPQGSKAINFKDFAVLADSWLDEVLWPTP